MALPAMLARIAEAGLVAVAQKVAVEALETGKTLRKLPKDVAELHRRMAALEAALKERDGQP